MPRVPTSFVTDPKDPFWQRWKLIYTKVSRVINGNISFVGQGAPINPLVSGVVHCDNIDGVLVNTAGAVNPGVDVTLTHNLGRIPTGFWIFQQVPSVANTPGIAYDSATLWTTTTITIRFSAQGEYFLFIF